MFGWNKGQAKSCRLLKEMIIIRISKILVLQKNKRESEKNLRSLSPNKFELPKLKFEFPGRVGIELEFCLEYRFPDLEVCSTNRIIHSQPPQSPYAGAQGSNCPPTLKYSKIIRAIVHITINIAIVDVKRSADKLFKQAKEPRGFLILS